MSLPLISCIVAVFNGERYLKEALNSILAQTYRPLEILVVDDGSTDQTPQEVAKYGEEVRYFWQPNAGPASARNLGLTKALGEFITFLDADDLLHPEKFQRQIICFQQRPELEMCVTHAQNFWIPELQEEEARFRNHRLSLALPAYVTSALLARRTVFEKLGAFNASLQYTHDSDWFFRAEEQGILTEILPDTLVFRRFHHNNRSRLGAEASREEYFRLVKTTLDRQRSKEKPD